MPRHYMQFKLALLWIAALLPSTSNTQNTTAPPEAYARFAQQLVTQELHGHYDQVLGKLAPWLRTAGARGELIALSLKIPSQRALSGHMANARQMLVEDRMVSNFSFEYEYPRQWMLIQIAVCDAAGQMAVCGLHVRPMPCSLEVLNAFTLRGKELRQYAVLALAVLLPLLTLWTLKLCWREHRGVGRWLWALAIICGVGEWAVGWTDGHSSTQWVGWHLLSARVTTAEDGQTLVGVSLPLAALWFLMLRYELAFFGTRRPRGEKPLNVREPET